MWGGALPPILVADPEARFVADETERDRRMIKREFEGHPRRRKLDQYLHCAVDEGDTLAGRKPGAVENVAAQAFGRADGWGQKLAIHISDPAR